MNRELETAAAELLHHGELDVRSINELVRQRDPSGDCAVWSRDYLRHQHFVSMYLPIRYWAWARMSQRRNAQTEAELGTLVATVAETLWGGLCEAGPQPPDDLCAMVFGPENPLRLRDAERGAWAERFNVALDATAQAWRGATVLPRWEALSLHFVSFYLPMGAGPLGGAIGAGSGSPRRRLFDALSERVHPDVVCVVRRWFEAAAAERDAAGVPIVEPFAEGGRELIARTRIEVLLLAS